jgi:hypothetical protein
MGGHGLGDVPPEVRTAYLGQYPRVEANRIAGELEDRGIVWWYKEPGFLSGIWEIGVRVFVDKLHLDEAREIARRIDRDEPGGSA